MTIYEWVNLYWIKNLLMKAIFLLMVVLAFVSCDQLIPIPKTPYGFSIGDPYGTLHIQAFFDFQCYIWHIQALIPKVLITCWKMWCAILTSLPKRLNSLSKWSHSPTTSMHSNCTKVKQIKCSFLLRPIKRQLWYCLKTHRLFFRSTRSLYRRSSYELYHRIILKRVGSFSLITHSKFQSN